MEPSHRPFDADNHYYESLDAFTRYQDPAMSGAACRCCSEGKRAYIVVADKINRFIPNPTFNPVIVPGCTELLFRGQMPEGVDPAHVACRSSRSTPEYQDREQRAAR